MTIIPNPNSGSIRVKLGGLNPDSEVHYFISDLSGRRLYLSKAKLAGAELEISNLNLAAGTYVIEVQDKILKVSGKFNVK